MENNSLGNSLRYSVALLSWQRTLALWSHLWHVTSKSKRSRHNHTQQHSNLKSKLSSHSKAGARINDIWKLWAWTKKEIEFRHFSIMGRKAKYQIWPFKKEKKHLKATLLSLSKYWQNHKPNDFFNFWITSLKRVISKQDLKIQKILKEDEFSAICHNFCHN